MPTNITFNDGAAATLDNGKPAPADRFANWVPVSRPIGPRRHALGSGQVAAYTFRTDHGARFELRMIPNADADVAARLIRHLLAGGSCTINTGDSTDESYSSVELWPDSEPRLELSDPAMLEYTLYLEVVRRDGTDAPMECVY